jgi:hypothetical protein
MIEDYEEEIIEYIDASFSSLKNGLVIFLWGDDDLFEIVELPRSVKNRYYLSKQAEVKPLLAYMDEYKKLLWIVVDKRQAQVYLEYMWDVKKIEEIIDVFWEFDKSTDKMWYFGRWFIPGWGYAENVDKQEWILRRYVNVLWKELLKLKDQIWFERVVVITPEKIAPIVEEELGRDLKAITAKVIKWNYTKANINTIKNLLIDVEKEIERQEEEQMIDEVYSNLWNSDYKKWVAGLTDVLKHLNQWAVWYLLIQENIEFPWYIWKDSGFLYLSEDENELNEELIKVEDLTNDIVTKAIEQDARVNFVNTDNEKLAKMWNIAAMVRFKI